MKNIIADFTRRNYESLLVDGLTQWDYGRLLEVRINDMPEKLEAHFGYEEITDTLIVDVVSHENVAIIPIPNVILTQNKEAVCWIYYQEENCGATEKTIKLAIEPRKKPSDYVFTEVELKTYEALEAKLNNIKISDEQIQNSVNQYLENNPIESGATKEQLEQIKKNKEGVESLSQHFSPAKEYVCENLGYYNGFYNSYYDSELEAIRWTHNLSDNEYQSLLSNVGQPLYYKIIHNGTLYEGAVLEYKLDENNNLVITEWLVQDSNIGLKVENNTLYYYIGGYESAEVDFSLYFDGDKECINAESIPSTIARVKDIPTHLSMLESDSYNRTVTDDEKETWNNKSEFSGNWNDLEDKPFYEKSSNGAVFKYSVETGKGTLISDITYNYDDFLPFANGGSYEGVSVNGEGGYYFRAYKGHYSDYPDNIVVFLCNILGDSIGELCSLVVGESMNTITISENLATRYFNLNDGDEFILLISEINKDMTSENIQRLDEKFIPDTIATKKYVDDSKVKKTSQLDNDLNFLTYEEMNSYLPSWWWNGKPSYTASELGADKEGTAESKVSEHNVSNESHNDIRLDIIDLANRLNALADSDDTTLDQMSEIVAYIKSNKSLIDAVTTQKISYSDIIDNLTTNVSDKPLSAAQGVALKALFDGIPSWAKAETKPSYTATEVGALPDTTQVPSNLSDLKDDTTHRTVTDSEKNAWNSKSTFSGKYEDLQGMPFKLGIDANGNYGYIKAGADTVTPFKSMINAGKITIGYIEQTLDLSKYKGITLSDIYLVPTSFNIVVTTGAETGEIAAGTYNIKTTLNNGILRYSRDSVPGKVGLEFNCDVYIRC